MGHSWLNGWGICHLMSTAFITYWVGHLWLNRLGIYDLMGGAVTTSCCFIWKYAQKMLLFRGVPFLVII